MPPDSVFPVNVTSAQVLALLESLKEEGGKVDVAKLADDFRYNINTILPVLKVAEMLELVKIDQGDASLTELGRQVLTQRGKGLRVLKEKLVQSEPFKTAVELAKKMEFVTAKDVCEALKKKGIIFSSDDDENEQMVEELLVHWAIYTDALKYDGKTAVFSRTS